ncbi:MAG: hypothetical protein JSW18_01490 [Candidatus Omnitrophota bacterium]|nr:MAG: hypothetical protein JSW18_01490 [Candidatus Omnitrophota bacterium]
MKKQNNQKTIVMILAILLVLAVGYIAVNKYIGLKQKQQISIYQQGMQAGYRQAIIQLIQQASTCQQVPVYIENQTINLIAVGCLQRP